MSHEERKSMQLLDKIILGADSKKLAEIQKIDIDTQLDGVWFYDIYTPTKHAYQKPDIKINKFKKK